MIGIIGIIAGIIMTTGLPKSRGGQGRRCARSLGEGPRCAAVAAGGRSVSAILAQ